MSGLGVERPANVEGASQSLWPLCHSATSRGRGGGAGTTPRFFNRARTRCFTPNASVRMSAAIRQARAAQLEERDRIFAATGLRIVDQEGRLYNEKCGACGFMAVDDTQARAAIKVARHWVRVHHFGEGK